MFHSKETVINTVAKSCTGKSDGLGQLKVTLALSSTVSLTATMNDFSVTFLSVYVILNEV